MVKAVLLTKSGKGKQVELPGNFNSPIRKDILLKVFEAQKRKQVMGNEEYAGMKYSAMGTIHRKRHSWKVSYGKGISRTPRKTMSRDGASFNWVGASAPNTRGGRQSHPPKEEENQFKKINKKELRIAINSALSGLVDRKSMEKKYGKINGETLCIASSELLTEKTKDFIKTLQAAFNDDRILKYKTQRPGKGKSRGRRFKSNAGMIFVLADDEKMNRKGIDVCTVSELTIKDLSPNGFPGRFACFTEKAIKQLGEKLK